MRVMHVRNVNEALAEGMRLLARRGEHEQSRNGEVVVLPVPLTTVTYQPTERVLFSPARDANPFFHLYECLWMLAGRDDAASLNHYIKDFGARFADDGGKTIHDAYGHRWRESFGFDQLNVIIDKLRANPGDRQCVLQMWDCSQEDHHSDDLLGDWKARPCNTHVYFRVRREQGLTLDAQIQAETGDIESVPVLDMTVCCRSNDAVWGAHGANAVHFSFLQEYMAGMIGVRVGFMYQVSNNYHGYVDVLNKIGEPENVDGCDYYSDGSICPMSIGNVWSAWDNDLRKFMRWHDTLWDDGRSDHVYYTNRWFDHTVMQMTWANYHRVKGDLEAAIINAQAVEAHDWRTAAVEWLQRRQDGGK